MVRQHPCGRVSELTPRLLAEVQRPAPVAATDALRPTVALVLGGGGPRDFAHMGVLRTLEEVGIKPDMVVGTSAGAVVGAAYASGHANGVGRTQRQVVIARGLDLKPLSRQNLFALAFRTNNMKTPAGRAKKIEALVSMLARGETIVPQGKRMTGRGQ